MPAVAPFKTTDNGWLTKWELHDRPTGLASRWCAPAWHGSGQQATRVCVRGPNAQATSPAPPSSWPQGHGAARGRAPLRLATLGYAWLRPPPRGSRGEGLPGFLVAPRRREKRAERPTSPLCV